MSLISPSSLVVKVPLISNLSSDWRSKSAVSPKLPQNFYYWRDSLKWKTFLWILVRGRRVLSWPCLHTSRYFYKSKVITATGGVFRQKTLMGHIQRVLYSVIRAVRSTLNHSGQLQVLGLWRLMGNTCRDVTHRSTCERWTRSEVTKSRGSNTTYVRTPEN